jgi:hypothetical protein
MLEGLMRQLGLRRRQPRHPAAPVIVLGMHRSGTSLLAGSLQLAGLELGRVSQKDKFNARGSRENSGIVSFHDAVLEAHGFSWKNPPMGEIRWTAAERARAQAEVAELSAGGLWGFKDPRSLLMIRAWRGLCREARFIGIFRNPVDVAASLVAMRACDEATAYELWDHYNRRLLALHQELEFPLLCFDDSAEWLHERLAPVLPQLGLAPSKGIGFYSKRLKHHSSTREDIPADHVRLYDALRARRV